MMTIKTRSIACGLLLFLTGCAHPRPVAPPPVSPNLHIRLTISPAPPRQLDLSVFTVTVTDAQRKPVKEANVLVRLTMPTMAMPENVVTTNPVEAGTWVGAGRFTMAGEWLATVTAAKGADKTVQAFPVTVK